MVRNLRPKKPVPRAGLVNRVFQVHAHVSRKLFPRTSVVWAHDLDTASHPGTDQDRANDAPADDGTGEHGRGRVGANHHAGADDGRCPFKKPTPCSCSAIRDKLCSYLSA